MRLIVRFQPTTVEKTVESGQKQDRAFDSDDGAAKVKFGTPFNFTNSNRPAAIAEFGESFLNSVVMSCAARQLMMGRSAKK